MLEPGERIGDWVVESTLGEGGMGAVFRCHNALTERISAAVKVMKPDRVEDVRDRFVREVEALDGLNHSAIVRVKGWGEDESRGLLWLAMDLVEGEDLCERLRRGALSVDEVLEVFTDIAKGMAHAHEQGIYHRDIKPANLLLCAGGARLVDFGIAIDEGKTRLTAVGQIPGTPAYLGPEVFSGNPDPRMLDIYALGQVLCEALTGNAAFPDQPTLGTTQRLANLMGQKIHSQALDPGEGYPEHLRELVRRSTSPQPSVRLGSMADFAVLLEGGTVSPPSSSIDETMTFDLDDLPDEVRPPSQVETVPAMSLPAPPPEAAEPEEEPPAPVQTSPAIPIGVELGAPPTRRMPWMAIGGAAVVTLLLLAVLGALLSGVFTTGPRDVEVVLTGLAAGTPVVVRIGDADADVVDGHRFRFLAVDRESSQLTVLAGAHCDLSASATSGCPECCSCLIELLEPDDLLVLLAVEPPITGVDVVVSAPGVAEPWPLSFELEGTAGELVDRSTRRFSGLEPGKKPLKVQAGECPPDVLSCWPEACPEGCSSFVTELTLSCSQPLLETAVPLGSPETPVEAAAPAAPARIAGLAGVRVKLLHRAGQRALADRASRVLSAQGCVLTIEAGNEGGMWGPFWGNAYYFRADLGDEVDSIRNLLSGLGYLAPGEHNADQDDVDVVLWLQE